MLVTFTGILAFLFVLGVVVFVHELGHFLVARWHGVRVLTFSLGFGPKLVHMRRGDTDYCISAIPLGGYVKMAGESLDDPGSGRSDEYLSKTRWQRFQILLAGAAMNFVLAIVVMAGVLWQGAQVPLYEEQPPVVGRVAPDSPAARAGISPGDRIVSIDGNAVPTWYDLQMAVLPRAEEALQVVFVRDGVERTLTLTPKASGDFKAGDLGVSPDVHPQFGRVDPGSVAEKAGLRDGDVILGVNGKELGINDLVGFINKHANKQITLSVRRGSEVLKIDVTPELKNGVGLIGVTNLTPMEVRNIEPGFFQAIGMSVQQNLEWGGLIFRLLGGLFTRQTSLDQLAGPIGIAQFSGTAAEAGALSLFTFLAMISLNLGVINLLPIPVLDGGNIFIMALEGLARRDFSVAVKERVMLAGVLVILLLMVTVFYNDLIRIGWLGRIMPGN
ncbi:MAG: RIP metalloprotease RseP [Luteitalea sp.]|nr:RIP metalloprotease RseP [Luteitalea sp.]